MSTMAHDPAALLAALQQGGEQQAPDPLSELQQVIQDLHALIAVLPDPEHTQVATQCLLALTKVQKDLMTPQGGDSRGATMRQLGA